MSKSSNQDKPKALAEILELNKQRPRHRKGITKNLGYVLIYYPEHPNANRGYVKRSHLVIEEKLGRYLTKNEATHHINKLRDDDRIENLQVMTRAQHTSYHRSGHIPWNKDLTKETDERVKKYADKQKGREGLKGIKNPHYGKHTSNPRDERGRFICLKN